MADRFDSYDPIYELTDKSMNATSTAEPVVAPVVKNEGIAAKDSPYNQPNAT